MKIAMLFLVAFLVACSPVVENASVAPLKVDVAAGDASEPPEVVVAEPDVESPTEEAPALEPASADWKTFRFTDVRTGDTFSVADFSGQKVLLESFAVWCPTCTRQQKVFAEMEGDIVHISFDTDPNEDREAIVEHLDRHGFDWLYAIAPASVSKSLIDEFGITIVNAPSAPVVLVCEDGGSRMLPSGLKKIDEINDEVALGC